MKPNTKRCLSLSDSVQFIKGVGPRRAAMLKKRGIETAEDCFFFVPHRYEDRGQVKTIAQLKAGEHATFWAKIIDLGTTKGRGRRKFFEMIVSDDSGFIRAIWFRFNAKYMCKRYSSGQRIILSGKLESDWKGGSSLQIIHPNIELDSAKGISGIETGRIIPIYYTTEGLHLKTLRTIMYNVLEQYLPFIEDFLPESIVQRNRFPKRSKAFREVHFPSKNASLKDLGNSRSPGHRRIIFEELFLIQLALAYRKRNRKDESLGFSLKTRGQTIQRFIKRIKFELTEAQKRALGEIMGDLEKDKPMNRLLQGDVGSGKTIVAFITLLTAFENGYQGALMAPTEILAEQHFLNLKADCEALGVSLELVTSNLKPKEKKTILKKIRNGAVHLIIGTHALIQQDVEFKNLGTTVIDEQHRFGVRQRESLTKKGLHPHTLTMTATPIPRSLALTLYGDMDVSLLNELPPGRYPKETQVFYGNEQEQAYYLARKKIDEGRQVYVVCPLIEETETMDLKTVSETREQLQRRFPDLTVDLLHGQMKKEERAHVMAQFRTGKTNILVATTIIEVGIDIPNASLMIVEHAERFGLSQLHQLRGRIGRGEHQSHCLLIAYYPLTEDAKTRLEVMRRSSDGFVVAEEDLKIRGPGDFMGTRQSGMPELRVANLIRDVDLLTSARKEAFLLIDQDSNLSNPSNQKLKREFKRVMSGKLGLMDII
tara:strand:- start:226 stop:2355 length:2130 start_codon:yes stop_codon:yes gene_type:complete